MQLLGCIVIKHYYTRLIVPRVQRGGGQHVRSAVRGCRVWVVKFDSCQVRVVKCDKGSDKGCQV